jgi:hypothetical protein
VEDEMIDKPHRRQPVPGRARKRAIRAQAARAGVPYAVAARQLGAGAVEHAAGPGATDATPGWLPASQGRTVYPAGSDSHRRWLVACRQRRDAAQRLLDTRLAADLPAGRARHLTERFPPTRGEHGSGVGPLYHGAGRGGLLAALYQLLAGERPDLVPSVGALAWEAELGEETAIDTACARLDRAARRLLDAGPADLYPRLAAVAGTVPGRPAFEGARQILDALLVVAEDGHAPGTRVRLLAGPDAGASGTIVGALWSHSGPPSGYEVRPDGWPCAVPALPAQLWVPAGDDLPVGC